MPSLDINEDFMQTTIYSFSFGSKKIFQIDTEKDKKRHQGFLTDNFEEEIEKAKEREK